MYIYMNVLTGLHVYTHAHTHSKNTYLYIQRIFTYMYKEHLQRPKVFMDNEFQWDIHIHKFWNYKDYIESKQSLL